ncbi:hypothetical protein L3X38_043089 [Prunus dulcis]|uniref:Uncharacterized protein n=1 Tax=Prunus dulcis TaxID=3755 RepID=A0AAD4YMK8_PRUDU|nr:hypothetical protein L3X38_043089 [Prunus dulcis]
MELSNARNNSQTNDIDARAICLGIWLYGLIRGDKVFRCVKPPDGYNMIPFQRKQLAVWNEESIALFKVCGAIFEIWVMDDLLLDAQASSGTKCFTSNELPPDIYPNVMLFWNSQEVLMIATYGRIVSYNAGMGNVKYLPLKTTACHYSGSNVVQAVDCVNSIVSVKRGNKLELGANIGLRLPI